MRRGWIWGGLLNPPGYMHFGKITVGEDANPLGDPTAACAQLNRPSTGRARPRRWAVDWEGLRA
jgi:hypothetical protein